MTEGSDDRIQKVLAHAGLGSRRACEELILAGRVTVNGKVVRELGSKCDARGVGVAVDGEKILAEKPVYFAVYKPKGYVSTNADPSGRPRVLDLLPEIPQRVYTVGRLDEMSNGLIILTNDGTLAHKLAHPKYGVEKLYRVVCAGTPTPEVLKQLTDGIWLAEGKVRAKRVRAVGKRGESTILEMVLSEGKNREVRRMLAKLGHKVMSLTRIAVGPITIKGLSSGEFRPLTANEVGMLRKVAAGEYVAPFPRERRAAERPPRPRAEQPRPNAEERGPRSNSGAPRPTGNAGRPSGNMGRPERDQRPSGAPSRPTSDRKPARGDRRTQLEYDDDDDNEPPVPRPKGPVIRDGQPVPRPRELPPSQRGPGGPAPAKRRDDSEREVDPLGSDYMPSRGRRVLGMEGAGGGERSGPSGKRPLSKPKGVRKSPPPLKPRRRPGGNKSD